MTYHKHLLLEKGSLYDLKGSGVAEILNRSHTSGVCRSVQSQAAVHPLIKQHVREMTLSTASLWKMFL